MNFLNNNQILLDHLDYLEEIFEKYHIDPDKRQDSYLAILQSKRLSELTEDKQIRGYMHNLVKYINWQKDYKIIYDSELYENKIKEFEC